MKRERVLRRVIGIGASCALLLMGCEQKAAPAPDKPAEAAEPAGIAPTKVADMLHAIMEADRVTYTKQVVNRLVKEQKIQIMNPATNAPEAFHASEQWKTEQGTLPLPAQMFRMGAEAVAAKNVGFTYGLLSKWPLNKQNAPKTAVETAGLQAVVDNNGAKPFYGEEELGGTRYFTAVYADVAVAAACVDCHNEHKDAPRTDFEVGDVMGGVVLRIPM